MYLRFRPPGDRETFFGTKIFVIDVKLVLTEEEIDTINEADWGDTILYENDDMEWEVTLAVLHEGKRFESKRFTDLKELEEALRASVDAFSQVLEAAVIHRRGKERRFEF